MDGPIEITVIISTYNRREMLRGALESVLGQQAEVSYEVIVVDNNSTDGTRELIESYRERYGERLRYVYEGRQGVSYARNAGIGEARGRIIAFADDDVRVMDGWVGAIKRAFDEHPEVDFVGGKVLPRWLSSPPAWLTRDHWAPLALLDHGDEERYSNAAYPLCLPTANASFRREVFERVGLFSPEFSGREDHEFELRLWRAGRAGLYVPHIVVTADVQPERLTKAYHRRWFTITGRFNSLMRLNEVIGRDGGLIEEPAEPATLFGAPLFLYHDLAAQCRGWIRAEARRQESLSLMYELRARYLIAYIRMRRKVVSAGREHSYLAEIRGLARALLRKRVWKV